MQCMLLVKHLLSMSDLNESGKHSEEKLGHTLTLLFDLETLFISTATMMHGMDLLKLLVSMVPHIC